MDGNRWVFFAQSRRRIAARERYAWDSSEGEMEKESGVRPINGDDYEYDGEQFEEDEATLPPRRKLSGELDQHQQSSLCSWKTIDLGEIELGEQLGGGSVGLVHRGIYRGELVALKMLVSEKRDFGSQQPRFFMFTDVNEIAYSVLASLDLLAGWGSHVP